MVYYQGSAFYLPHFFAAGGLGLLLIPWLIRLPRLAAASLLSSLVIGQLIRLPLPGQGGGLLTSDLGVVVVLLAALTKLITGQPPTTRHALHITFLLLPFALWSLFLLTVNAPQLGLSNTAISFAYWLRLTSQLLLLPALLILLADQKCTNFIRLGLLASVALLAVIGFCQFFLFPNLAALVTSGWDPHHYRLVSTWLDPNLFGAFLALSIPFIILNKGHRRVGNLASANNNVSNAPPLYLILPLALLALAALFLTQSRSALLALLLTTIFLLPLTLLSTTPSTSRRALTAATIFILVIIVSAGGILLAKDRLLGLLLIDETVRIRFTALQQAWNLAQNHTALGAGYNAYQFVALKAGTISHFYIHSRAGADNSLLTLWTTTGLSGLVLFFLPFFFLAHRLLISWFQYRNCLALAALFAGATLFIHAQFVNSLLYSHLLITLIIVISLALSPNLPHSVPRHHIAVIPHPPDP